MMYGINGFVVRQTQPGFAGTSTTMDDLRQIVQVVTQTCSFYEGYAPYVRNFKIPVGILSATTCGEAEITAENLHLLKSGYKVRAGGKERGEVPHLTRWFEGVPKPPAKAVTAVFYSKEHLVEEGVEVDGDEWDLITVLGGANPEIDPASVMYPETILRNALGKEFGGSGKPIDREFYERMVDHASRYALIG